MLKRNIPTCFFIYALLLSVLFMSTCSDSTSSSASADLNPETKENIARALGMREYIPELISLDVMNHLGNVKNSKQAFGERMQSRILDLLANPENCTPDYTDRYTTLYDYSAELTPHQAYAMNNLLGLDSSRGYQKLPTEIAFQFPYDDRPQYPYQVGWHFFVGSAFTATGQEYSVQLMFWRYSLLPPEMGKTENLSDLENQIVEIHFAISALNDRHYRIKPVVLAGTTGLISFSENPFCYAIGKNKLTSLANDSLFPLRLQAWGIDNRDNAPVEIAIDITLNQTKGYVLNGDQGLSPSCGGVGTLYYSVPNLRLEPSKSWLSIDGAQAQLTDGKFWYDHQWGTGFMPSGNPRSDVLRAVGAQEELKPGGWDWMEIQFDDDTEIALSALHTNENAAFYCQTGANPPGNMTADAKGSYIQLNGEYETITATILVTEWIKSIVEDDQYEATHTWYPNRVEVTVAKDTIPEDKRHFIMTPIVSTGQQGYFASGVQYSEGAVIIESTDGKRIGVGFLENVGYADSRKQNLRMAGLPDTDEMVLLFSPVQVSEEVKNECKAFIEEPDNFTRLMEELADCKGL